MGFPCYKFNLPKEKQIRISLGNNKLGKIPNISLPPIITCKKNAPCTKTCYASKAWRLYPNTRKSWTQNLTLFTEDHKNFFNQISYYLNVNNPKHFRWQCAGDIVNKTYFTGMIQIAKDYPKTKFLVFTKQYNIIRKRKIPSNLQIVLSVWPKIQITKINLPKAWFQDGTETRYSEKNTIKCPGHCEGCFNCWNLTKLNKDIVFIKH